MDRLINKNWDFLIVVSVGVSLLLPILINNILIIVFVLYTIFKVGYLKKYQNNIDNKYIYIIILLILIPLVSLINTGDLNNNLKFIEKNLPFLVLPLAFSQVKKIDKSKICLLFAICAYIVSFIFIINGLYKFYLFGSIEAFFYKEFTSLFEIHPIYFGMYFLFSTYVLIKNRYTIKHFTILIIIYSVLVIVLISSKTILSLFGIILICILKKRRFHAFLAIFTIALLIILTPYTRERILTIINSDYSILSKQSFAYNEDFTGLTLRLVQWKLGFQHMYNDNNTLLGVGAGNSQKYINQIYTYHNLDSAGYLNFNMHNLYIDFFIKYGLVGILVLLFIFTMLFRVTIIQKQYYLTIFIIIFSITGMTENVLGINKGIVFLAYFGSLIFYNSNNLKLENLN